MISEKVLLEIEDTLERFKDTLEAVGITDPACYNYISELVMTVSAELVKSTNMVIN